ncbi:MAG TPA: hypothetical protein VJO52_16115 [Gemmatimonadaceae bacterium]|nr:hypothetical protein [Gemmatimonadaceae bacterium]
MPFRAAFRFAFTATLCAIAACRAPAVALGTPATTDQLLASLAARFGPHDRNARLDALRPRFAKSALVPSTLFHDNTAWTASSGETRTLVLAGHGTPDHYALIIAGDAPPPAQPADYRRVMRLTHAGDDDYAWNVRDELAVGTVTGDQLGAALTALFTAAEHAGGDPAAARAALAHDLPRTTAALGRAVSLDTFRLTPNTDGGANVHLAGTIHADRLTTTFPRLAHYLSHYVSPTGGEILVFDDANRAWWDAAKRGDSWSLDLRVSNGNLAPLRGPPDRMPDRLHVRIDAATHTFIFRVGLASLIGDVTLTHAPNDHAFTATFRKEPDWQLPPFVEQMLHSPLERPFQGAGASLTFDLRDGQAHEAPSVIFREYDLTVRESRIMRWLGNLSDAAVEDFRTGAEVEFDRFSGQTLSALRADVQQLVTQSAQ